VRKLVVFQESRGKGGFADDGIGTNSAQFTQLCGMLEEEKREWETAPRIAGGLYICTPIMRAADWLAQP
jgi:hypothetical protein